MGTVWTKQKTLYFEMQTKEDFDECSTGNHLCDKNAICTNVVASYFCTCKEGFSGNGIVCSSPARFQTHPQSYSIKTNTSVLLECSYGNYTAVSFSWMKDGTVLDTSKLKLSSTTTVQKTGSGFFAGSTQVSRSLSFTVEKADQQGFYWCRIQDSFSRTVESNRSTIKFTDVSTTKMTLTIDQVFSSLLLDASTEYYKSFENSVTKAIKSALSQKGITEAIGIVLQNIRPGSVIVDALIYYTHTQATKIVNICAKDRLLSAQDLTSSNFVVVSTSLTSYECCFSESTGDAAIKGIIQWPDTAAGTTANVTCPYNSNNNNNNNLTTSAAAFRQCKSFGFSAAPKWQTPNNAQCPYKTKTTQALSELSEEVINSSTVVQAAAKLNNLTKNSALVTNNLDIKFAVDTVNNIVNEKQSLDKVADDVLNVTNNLMDAQTKIVVDAQQKYQTSQKLLAAVQNLANNIQLENSTKTFTASKKNLAVGVALVSTKVSGGFLIRGKKTNKNGFINITLEVSTEEKMTINDVANIFLPESLLKTFSANASANRITTFLYDNTKLFVTKLNSSTTEVIDSKIISTSIKGVVVRNLKESEELRGFYYPLNPNITGTPACVFWNVTTSAWSSDGCRYVGDTSGFRICRCNHLTNFAVLMNVGGGKVTPKEKLALNIITYIGCGISLLAITIMLVTFAVFREVLLKVVPPRIHLCLCISIMGLIISLLIGMNAKNQTQCQATSVLVHYFVLSAFFWMASEAFNLYLSFVKVFQANRHHMLRRMMLFSWGLPIIIVAISAGVTKLEHYTSKVDGTWVCMVRGIPFYVAYLAPILVIATGNLVVMIISFKKIFHKSAAGKASTMDAAKKIRIAAACTVIMGSTWVLGVFALGELTFTFQLLFTIFNSLQGLFIFIFYCALSQDVQKEWKKLLCGYSDSALTSTGKVSTSSHVKDGSKGSSKGLTKSTSVGNSNGATNGTRNITDTGRSKSVGSKPAQLSVGYDNLAELREKDDAPIRKFPVEADDSLSNERDDSPKVRYHVTFETPAENSEISKSSSDSETKHKNVTEGVNEAVRFQNEETNNAISPQEVVLEDEAENLGKASDKGSFEMSVIRKEEDTIRTEEETALQYADDLKSSDDVEKDGFMEKEEGIEDKRPSQQKATVYRGYWSFQRTVKEPYHH